jgi:hypothetical protein
MFLSLGYIVNVCYEIKSYLEGETFDCIVWFICFSLKDVSSMRTHKDAENDEEILINSKIIIDNIVSNINEKAKQNSTIYTLKRE